MTFLDAVIEAKVMQNINQIKYSRKLNTLCINKTKLV